NALLLAIVRRNSVPDLEALARRADEDPIGPALPARLVHQRERLARIEGVLLDLGVGSLEAGLARVKQAVGDLRLSLEERCVQLVAVDPEQQSLADAGITEERVVRLDDQSLQGHGREVHLAFARRLPPLLRNRSVL